jgi:predicted metal-dependent phosphoesterase TrpH
MGLIDLHIHSTYSDGTLSPRAIVDLARKTGLQAIALTDHDTVAGVAEALAYGREAGVEVIPGIEISSWLDNIPLHILGYRFRHNDSGLLQRLLRLQEGRHIRNEQILSKLNHLGIDLTMAELTAFSEHGQAGRPHIAQLLVNRGAVPTLEQAFRRYLQRGAAAYAERFKYYADEAINMIRQAGGIAVLAHPVNLDPSLTAIPGLLRELHQLGLQGVEVYYPSHSSQAVRKLKKIAAELGLLITGGSDFHGNNRSKAPLGGTKKSRVPHHILETLNVRRSDAQAGSREQG